MTRPRNFRSKLLSKISLTDNILECVYSVPEDFIYEPGQFVNVSVTPPFRRPYSVVEVKDSKIKLIVNITNPGKGADYFRETKVSDETEIMGPLGRFTMKDTDYYKVFIASGVGVAPFIPMIKKLMDPNDGKIIKTTLYLGIRSLNDDVLARQYLIDLIEADNEFSYVRSVTKPEHDELEFFEGRVTTLLREQFDFDVSQTEFYVCGGNDMVKEVKQILEGYGADKVYVENYG